MDEMKDSILFYYRRYVEKESGDDRRRFMNLFFEFFDVMKMFHGHLLAEGYLEKMSPTEKNLFVGPVLDALDIIDTAFTNFKVTKPDIIETLGNTMKDMLDLMLIIARACAAPCTEGRVQQTYQQYELVD